VSNSFFVAVHVVCVCARGCDMVCMCVCVRQIWMSHVSVRFICVFECVSVCVCECVTQVDKSGHCACVSGTCLSSVTI